MPENASMKWKSKLPFEKTGVCPVSCSNTLAALVNLSPDSPTQISTHNFLILNSLIGFLDLSFGSFLAFFTLASFTFSTLAGATAFWAFGALKNEKFWSKLSFLWGTSLSLTIIFSVFFPQILLGLYLHILYLILL